MDTLYKYMVDSPQPCVYFVISDKEQMKLYSLLSSINKSKSPSRPERVYLKVVEKDKMKEVCSQKANWFEKVVEEPTCVVYCTDWQKYKVESSKSLTTEYVSDPNLVDILSGSIGIPSNMGKDDKHKKDKKDKTDRFDEIDFFEEDLIKITSKSLERKIREDIDKFLLPNRIINSRKSIPHKFLFLVTLNKNIKNPNKVIGGLKSLDPSEVCAVCVSCGLTDIHSKLEKLEQMIYETSLSYFEKKNKKLAKIIINLKTQLTGNPTEVTELYNILLNFKIAYFSEFLSNRKDAYAKYNLCWNSLKQINTNTNIIDKTSLSFFICLRIFDFLFVSGDISGSMSVYIEYKKYLEKLILERYRGLYYNLMYVLNYFIAYKLEKSSIADEKNSNILLQQSTQYYKWTLYYLIELRKHIIDINHPMDEVYKKDFYNKDEYNMFNVDAINTDNDSTYSSRTSNEGDEENLLESENEDKRGERKKEGNNNNNEYGKINGDKNYDTDTLKTCIRKYHMPTDFNNIFYYEDSDYHYLYDDYVYRTDELTEDNLRLYEDDLEDICKVLEDDRKFEIESRKLILKNFTLFKNLNYSKNLVYSYSLLGDSFYLSSNYKDALKIYLNTLKHVLYNINFNQMYSTIIRKYSHYGSNHDEGIYEIGQTDSMDFLEIVNMLMYSELICNELQQSMYFKLLSKVMLSLVNLLEVNRVPTILYHISDLTTGEDGCWWSYNSNKGVFDYQNPTITDRKFRSSNYSSRFRLDSLDENEKDNKDKKNKDEYGNYNRDKQDKEGDTKEDLETEANKEKQKEDTYTDNDSTYSSRTSNEDESINYINEEERETYKLILIKCIITFISIYNKKSKMGRYLNYLVGMFLKTESMSSPTMSLSSSYDYGVENEEKRGERKKEINNNNNKYGNYNRDKRDNEGSQDDYYDFFDIIDTEEEETNSKMDKDNKEKTKENAEKSRNYHNKKKEKEDKRREELEMERNYKEMDINIISKDRKYGRNPRVEKRFGNINSIARSLESYVLLSKNTKSQYMYKYQEGTIEIIVNFNTDVKLNLVFYEGFLDTSEGPLSFYYQDSELISNAFIIYTNHINGNNWNYGNDGRKGNNKDEYGNYKDINNRRRYDRRSETLPEQMNKLSLYRTDRMVELPYNTRVIMIIQLPFYPIKGFKINGIIFKSVYKEKLFVNSIMLTHQYVLNKNLKSLDMVNLGYYSSQFELEKHFSTTDNRYEEDNEKLVNLIYLSFNDIYKDSLVMDNYITMDRLELVKFMNMNLKIKVFVKNVVKNFMSPITIVLLYNSKFSHLYDRYTYELQVSHNEFYLLGKNDENGYMLFRTESIELDFNESVIQNSCNFVNKGNEGNNTNDIDRKNNDRDNKENNEQNKADNKYYSNDRNKDNKYNRDNKDKEFMNIKLSSSDERPKYVLYSHSELVKYLRDSGDEIDEDVLNYINIYKNNNDIYVMYGLVCINNAVSVNTQVPFNLYIKNFNTNKEKRDYVSTENRKQITKVDSQDDTLLYNKLLDIHTNDMSNININYKYYNNFDMLLYIHLVNSTDITYDLLNINILYNNYILTTDDKNRLYGYNNKIDSHQNLNLIYFINNYRKYNKKRDGSDEVDNIIQIQITKNIKQKLYYPFNYMKNFLKYTINKFIKIDIGNDKIQLVLKHKNIVNLGKTFQMEAEIINTTNETMEYDITLNDENEGKIRPFILEGPLNVSLVGAPRSSDTLNWTLIPISCDPFKTPSIVVVNKLDSTRKTMAKSRTSQIYVVP